MFPNISFRLIWKAIQDARTLQSFLTDPDNSPEEKAAKFFEVWEKWVPLTGTTLDDAIVKVGKQLAPYVGQFWESWTDRDADGLFNSLMMILVVISPITDSTMDDKLLAYLKEESYIKDIVTAVLRRLLRGDKITDFSGETIELFETFGENPDNSVLTIHEVIALEIANVDDPQGAFGEEGVFADGEVKSGSSVVLAIQIILQLLALIRKRD